ncbi:MAG: hypothetical protein IT336_00725 [Thermomicrobiales bacterium]|nr:hypothetical protein [Thermomicrobiales bacterium]
MTTSPVSTNDRVWSVAIGTGCSALFGLCLLVVVSWLIRTPTVEQAAGPAGSNELIAYSNVEKRPHLLTIDGDRLVYDRPTLDWTPVSSLEQPVWRLTEHQYRLQRTPTPASAALLLCAGDSSGGCDVAVELVGELRSDAITHVEIAVDGHWERHRVFGRGFIVPLDRRRQFGDVRWLNDGGEIVWSIDRNLDGRIAPVQRGAGSVTNLKQLQAR